MIFLSSRKIENRAMYLGIDIYNAPTPTERIESEYIVIRRAL